MHEKDERTQASTPPVVASQPELSRLAEELLAAAIATRRSEALLVRAQAAHLAWLSHGDRALECGFSSLTSLALELLGLRPRTTRERLALHRLFTRAPGAERAFLDGRLSACQALAAAPLLEKEDSSEDGGAGGSSSSDPAVARDRWDGAVERWIALAAGESVRSLRYEVRRRRAESVVTATVSRRHGDGPANREVDGCAVADDPDEMEGRMVTITGPLGFQIVFDRMMELSRMVLGFDAPDYMCIDAILMETGTRGIAAEERDDCGDGSNGSNGTEGNATPGSSPRPPSPIPIRPRDIIPHRPEAVSRARETLEQVTQYIADVEALIETGAPTTPHAALDALRQIQLLRAPQRVLFAHLIRDLRRTGVVDLLGYRSMAELVEDRLQLSERSARNRVAESILLEGNEGIEEAYGRGEITRMQAHLIHRLSRYGKLGPFVERARRVTWRQLQREVRLLELLRKCGLERVTRRPLPQSQVEEALIEALGGKREKIEQALRERGIPDLPPESPTDPAENPIQMERLEALVEMLALQHWDYLPPEEAGDRQMSAVLRREVTIRFWAPRSIAEDFVCVLRRLRKEDRRKLPYWAAAVFLFAEATEVWRLEDPERRPVRAKILSRDGYRCVIPGCRNRSRLESSHNRPRSLGGSNAASNQSTVCHTHHHHGQHKGRVKVSGEAPHALRFELGCRPDGPPVWILHGNKIVKGAFDPVPERTP